MDAVWNHANPYILAITSLCDLFQQSMQPSPRSRQQKGEIEGLRIMGGGVGLI